MRPDTGDLCKQVLWSVVGGIHFSRLRCHHKAIQRLQATCGPVTAIRLGG